MITAEHLIKEFTKTERVKRRTVKTKFNAVNDVSLTALDGETLGILGPNGAGKTTLLRMLGTVMEPTGGTVTHFLPDGSPLEKPEDIKRHMGYLSNNTKLYNRLSVREMLQLMGELYCFSAEQTDSRIEAVTEHLDMGGFLDNRIGKLSTGQTQRTSIARCLFADPQLYILDEPTLGLDVMSAAAIVDFIKAERQRGKTIIYSTHYLEEAQSLCDRILLLNRGRVLACGTPDELCAQTGTVSLRDAFLYLIEKDGGAQ